MNQDDPKLTAYVLGELSSGETAEMSELVESSPELKEAASRTDAVCRKLKAYYAESTQPGLTPAQRTTIRNAFSSRHTSKLLSFPVRAWIPALVGLAACLLLLPLAPWWHWWRSSHQSDNPGTAQTIVPEVQVNIGTLAALPTEIRLPAGSDADGFVDSAVEGTSFIPLRHSGKAAYQQIAAALERGLRPPSAQVRPFELLQYFQFHYPPPAGTSPVAMLAEIGPCPWNPEHRLARAGIKVRETKPGEIVLHEASLEVRFDPKRIKSWRLLGMEKVPGTDTGERGAADLESGDHVLALYEIVPATDSPAACTLVLHRTEPGSPVWENFELAAMENPDAAHSSEFQFAAAVTAFGLKLRDENAIPSWDDIRALASAGLGDDPDGERSRLIQLIDQAKLL